MSDSNAALIQQVQQTQVDNGIIFGLSALVFYEYIITLDEEIDIVWKRRWNAATVLFMVNRYLMVVYNAAGNVIPTTAGRYVSPSTTCTFIQIFLDVLIILQFIVFAVFATLRIYAIWNRNIPLALLIFALNLFPVVVNTYDFATDFVGFFVDPVAGPQCFEASKLSDSLNFRLATATRVALIVADALVLFLTWRKTFGMKSRAARLSVNTPFLTCIVRDGTVYFMALLVMNIAQIIMKEFPEFSAFPPTILFINSLTPVLISRFLINLRNVDKTVTSGGDAGASKAYTVSAVSTMHFSGDGSGTRGDTERDDDDSKDDEDATVRTRRILGPLGEDLEDGARWLDDEDESEETQSGEGSGLSQEDVEKKAYDATVSPTPPSTELHGPEKVDVRGTDIEEVSRLDIAAP